VVEILRYLAGMGGSIRTADGINEEAFNAARVTGRAEPTIYDGLYLFRGL
jgi:hypothetical protein